jgi:hypothetical protein
MMKIKGTIIPQGYGGATNSIREQEPLIKRYVPEISSMRFGTVNVRLESPILAPPYDVETPSIEWQKGRWEKFGFIRAEIQLCTPESETAHCLLYYAETPPYHSDPFIVEVVTKDFGLIRTRECFIMLKGKDSAS